MVQRGQAFEQPSPQGEVVVGFYGATSGNVKTIGGQCNSSAAVVGQTGSVTRIGPAGPSGRPQQFARGCAQSAAVTGLKLWSGGDPFVVSRLDFVCTGMQLK